MIVATFEGDDLIAALERVDEELEQTLPVALQLGADMVVAHAKANHEYRDGSNATLTNSIGRGEVTGSFKGGDLGIEVAAGAPHAAAIEYGARPHKIKPRHRKVLRFAGKVGFVFASEVNHPGNRPYRYLRNALEAKMPEITEECAAAVDLAFWNAGLR